MHKYSLYRFFCRRLTVAEAELCKVRSKHLLLLQEVNVPRRGELMRGRGSVSSSACDTCFVGGESGPSQDMISRLLEDAMSSDVDFAGVEEEHKYRKRFFFHTPYMPVLIVCVCLSIGRTPTATVSNTIFMKTRTQWRRWQINCSNSHNG